MTYTVEAPKFEIAPELKGAEWGQFNAVVSGDFPHWSQIISVDFTEVTNPEDWRYQTTVLFDKDDMVNMLYVKNMMRWFMACEPTMTKAGDKRALTGRYIAW